MLSIFRTNQLFASILLAFYIVLVRSSAFYVESFPEPVGYGIFTQWVYDWIGYQSNAALITSMILLLIQAFYINILVSEHRLSAEVNLFPGLFYILISSFLPEFNYLTPMLMANTFFIIALGEVLATYKKPNVADRIFNVGFWIGIASLFYPSYLALIVFGFAGLNMLRAYKFRERLMSVCGLLIPYILAGTYFFWFKKWPEFLSMISQNFAFLSFVETTPAVVYRSLGIFTVLILVVNFSHRSYQLKQKMEVQRKINILFWGLLSTAFSVLIQSDITVSHLLITSFPIGILLSLNFTNMTSRMAEVIHLLLLAGVLALQFQPWLFPNL